MEMTFTGAALMHFLNTHLSLENLLDETIIKMYNLCAEHFLFHSMKIVFFFQVATTVAQHN